jgi:DNA topoisomerase IB
MTRLRRSNCEAPGIRRRRRGRGFSYSWEDGQPVDDPAIRERIRALAIPPAWSHVWICPWPHGHIQAVGTDAAGRRQYRYHDAWRKQRDQEKFDRIIEFGQRLPRLRKTVAADIALGDLCRDHVLATAVRLLDAASLRVGGKEYAHDNETYGLSSLLKSHVRVTDERVRLDFPTKGGQRVRIEVDDGDIRSVVATLKRRRRGGPQLLAWQDDDDWRSICSDDVNAYIKTCLGDRFSAKDFRTWRATVTAAVALATRDAVPATDAPRRRSVCEAVRQASDELRNTPAVCRASYIHPEVIELFHQGKRIEIGHRSSRLASERAVLRLLGGNVPGDSRLDARAVA